MASLTWLNVAAMGDAFKKEVGLKVACTLDDVADKA